MPNDQPLRDPKDPHNFPEDYIYENGKYANRCIECGSHFVGHKRRSLCHLCNRHPMEVIDFPNHAELEAKAEGDLNFVKSMNDEADRYREALEKIQKAEEASPTVTLLDFGEGLIALEDFLEDVLDPK